MPEYFHCNSCYFDKPANDFYGYSRTLCKTCRRERNHRQHMLKLEKRRKQRPAKIPAGWGWS